MKLGVTLLNHTTRQLSLTDEGARYFQHMKHLLESMELAEKEIIESHHTPKGLLRIDAATPIMLHLLLPLIKPFRERYPEISLSLISSETFINIIKRKVDVAIRAGNLNDSTLKARYLFTSYKKLVASPSYIQKYGNVKSVSELDHHTKLGFTDPKSLNHWPIIRNNDEPTSEIIPDISSNSGETLKQLCLLGNGIACLSGFMVDDEIKQGKLIEILPEYTSLKGMPINAVYYGDIAK